jgi:hypothetical protein
VFLDCKNPLCDCNKNTPVVSVASTATRKLRASTPTRVSGKFERMLLGVSQNMALSSTPNKTGLCASPTPSQHLSCVTATPEPKSETLCTASTTFDGTCICKECIGHAKLLHLAQHIASCTHAYQKLDNYCPDQAMVAIGADGAPKYKGTESMLPFATLLKAAMISSKLESDGSEKIKLRVGMNNDDCENSAFQMKAIMETLHVGSQCVSGDFFHGSKDPDTYDRSVDEETLRCMRLGNLAKQEQRHILLVSEVMGSVIIPHLGYFVTGSPAATNNLTTTKSKVRGTRSVNNTSTASMPAAVTVSLPETVGSGLNVLGSKQPGERMSYKTTTDEGVPSAGLSGHCTCTLSVKRSDGSLHTVLVEGTAHVKMGVGTNKIKVCHRGMLSSSIDDDTKKVGEGGRFHGPISIENAVDVTMEAHISSHLLTLSNRLQVPGSNMRASVFMGTDLKTKNNCETFYQNIVSSEPYQFVQLDENKRIQPGANVKVMLNQGVIPVIEVETAAGGEDAIIKKMGNATCAMIKAFDATKKDFIEYSATAKRFSQAMSPLKLSPELQDKYMLSHLGSLSSLKANFPDDVALKAQYKNMTTFTSHVTHVAIDESIAGRTKLLLSIQNHVKQMNTDYVNVRVADPIVMPSGEITTLYRVYNVQPGVTFG